MVARQPLTGIILVDCAKANAAQGLKVAARQCGYGSGLKSFLAALQSAGEEMGVEIEELEDLRNQRDLPQ
ncbi:MAG: hypothetical protein HC824_02705 [Synechococcales cyanobacterium RM1_1_8]|nr:hypothetical protein [Synechococcales cyanobacterium RM1_1_8]